MGRTCEWCGERIASHRRPQIRTCSTRCRVALHRSTSGRGIPAELRERPRWVRYRDVARNGKTTRVPVRLDGRNASSTDPDTWSTYAQVRGFGKKGFVLNGDGIVCIDLDHCLEDGKLTGRAAEIVAQLPSTYIEVSPSGTGLHVWGYADVPNGRRFPDGVEVYGTGRYITVTTQRHGRGSSLADISAVVADLL